jgi:uncharacterized protein YutE (UPF0331/DUF86 family)
LELCVHKIAPADAYSAFEALSQQGVEGLEDVEWKKIIGMRNALVQDYLNIEPEIIREVIKSASYLTLLAFANKGLNALK